MVMKRILFVDDDVDLLEAMRIFLLRQGYEVIVTTSCSKGLEILRTFHPDLVLLDITVGNEDGRLMCRQIKKQAEYEHIPVILISAYDDALKTYRDYGADNFVSKPFEFSDLVDTLNIYQ
jgi:DNA-binding response OmpR family regulator